MAHFAELDNNNTIIRVLVFSNDIVNKFGGDLSVEIENHISATTPFTTAGNSITGNAGISWKQTSYNNSFRKQFAGILFTYDPVNDLFISPKPFNSWILNNNFEWQAPDTKPTTEQRTYIYNGENRLYKIDWEESTLKWRGLKQEDYEEGGSQAVYNWNSSNNTWELV